MQVDTTKQFLKLAPCYFVNLVMSLFHRGKDTSERVTHSLLVVAAPTGCTGHSIACLAVAL